MKNDPGRKKSSIQTPKKIKVIARLLLSILVGFAGANFGFTADRLDPSQPKLIITYLNCGQGDAAVIQTPQGKVFLIDAGPNEQMIGGTYDAGESAVVPYLNKIRAKNVDGIVLTHPHLDHYGGIFSVLKKFKVLQFIDPGTPTGSPHYLNLLQEIDQRDIQYIKAQENGRFNWDPQIKVEVLGPGDSGSGNSNQESINNRSIVIKITYGKISFLFTGDIEFEGEKNLVKTVAHLLKCDVLKVAHHGSKTSSISSFLETVQPSVAVISCGRKNDYGHPHRSVLKRLRKFKTKIVRTDREGSIQIITDGNSFQIKTL